LGSPFSIHPLATGVATTAHSDFSTVVHMTVSSLLKGPQVNRRTKLLSAAAVYSRTLILHEYFRYSSAICKVTWKIEVFFSNFKACCELCHLWAMIMLSRSNMRVMLIILKPQIGPYSLIQ